MVVRARGYTLLKATDGEQALDMAMRERPDLIIMDIQLPELPRVIAQMLHSTKR